jgi:dTDP-4-amino-4,6-dideoxygalactose transaminase
MTSERTPSPIPFVDLEADHRALEPELAQLWRDVVATGQFVGGPLVERFEADFAAYCRRRHCIGVGNGTDALELMLAALGVGPGDEVIVPANGFVATPEAVVRIGATPVFADVDPATHLVTDRTIADVITPATVAVIVVHLYGQMPDMGAIGALADRQGIALLEDAAQAHGARWRGRPAGSFGAAGAFSFYPTKNLGAFGDGGAVVTDDGGVAARVRQLTNHGRTPSSHHDHDLIGRNSRLDALQAGVLLVKLPHLDRWNARRREIAARYGSRLAGSTCVPVATSPGATPVHYLEVIVVHDPRALEDALAEKGIGCGFHYPVACHRQPAFAVYAREPLPVSDWAVRHILSVPMYPSIEPHQVDRVCDALLEAESSVDPLEVPGVAAS